MSGDQIVRGPRELAAEVLRFFGKRPKVVAVHELLHILNYETSFEPPIEVRQAMFSLGYALAASNPPQFELSRSSAMIKANGHRRLQNLVDPAIRALARAIRSGKPCEACGLIADAKHASIVVKAAQIVLDRTGHGPSSKLEVAASRPEWLQYLTDEQLTTIEGWIAEAKARADGQVIDGEAQAKD